MALNLVLFFFARGLKTMSETNHGFQPISSDEIESNSTDEYVSSHGIDVLSDRKLDDVSTISDRRGVSFDASYNRSTSPLLVDQQLPRSLSTSFFEQELSEKENMQIVRTMSVA